VSNDLLRRYLSELVRSGQLRQSSSINVPVVKDWIIDQELVTGQAVSLHRRVQASKFASNNWPALLQQYRGNEQAAAYTLYNLLQAEFD